MPILLQDIRYALRQLRKSPGFTLVAVLTLALGIGANTAIYSLIHGVLRLPYPHSERLVAVKNVYPQGQGAYFSASYPDFVQWRDQTRAMADLTASATSSEAWTGHGAPELLRIDQVSKGYFGLYGVHPVLGRLFSPDEHVKGAAPVCVLSKKFWREKLGSDPGILGKPLDLNGKTYTVVGVVPSTLKMVSGAQVWMPLEPNPPQIQHGWNYLFVAGLLRPGAMLGEAQAELRSVQAQINKQFPDNKHGVALYPLSDAVFGNLHSLLWLLQAAVGFILLIACVNLANMLLARASTREREFAVRRALGASPGRMIQQALTESLLLAFGGAAAGLLVAWGLTHIPIAAWPKKYAPLSQIHLDGTVLVFTALLAVGTGVVFGLIPAWRVLKQDETAALTQSRAVTESREQRRTRTALVVVEIALAMLLVAGALHMTFYFIGLLHTNSGMDPEHTMAMTVSLSPSEYATPGSQSRFFDSLRGKLVALPGVTAVGAGDTVPYTPAQDDGDFTYDGQNISTASHNPFADFHFVTPGYFAAVGTPLLQGREFTPADNASSQKVMIIDRAAAERIWPGKNPIGRTIHCCVDHGVFTVVGVVGNVHFAGPAANPGLAFYMSTNQVAQPSLTFILRTHGDPMSLAREAQQAVSAIDPTQAVSGITTLNALADTSIAPQRTSTTVTAVLGLLALLLAGVGVYGVMAYSVSRREREFGLRIALGSNRAQLLRLLMSGVFRLTVIGLAFGVAAVFAFRGWMNSLLGANGTGWTNGSSPAALAVAALVLCAIAAAAALIPARRAMRVEPMRALRDE